MGIKVTWSVWIAQKGREHVMIVVVSGEFSTSFAESWGDVPVVFWHA